MFFFIPEITGG